MFSEELAILDRNTAKYMIDEMQNEMDCMQDKVNEMKGTIDAQKEELEKKQSDLKVMHEKYVESIKNTINILRSLQLSESEIITQICDKYQMHEAQVRQYL